MYGAVKGFGVGIRRRIRRLGATSALRSRGVG